VYGPKGQSLPPSYTIFGYVVKGLGVVKRIATIPVLGSSAGSAAQQPSKAVYIDKVTVAVS
jgi:cyclophilin family peptidyl-prolyl cis-trans isomerase